MKKYLVKILYLPLLVFAVTPVLPVFANESGTSNMEILREKMTADKKFVVVSNMNLTDAEEKEFWPIYESYQRDLHQIDERLGKVIEDYAISFNKGAVLNETAGKLLDEAIAIELAEARLKQAYVVILNKILPSAKVARYIQIESKIRAIIRYELAEHIPLVR